MENINAGQFFQFATQLLLHAIDRIFALSGKEDYVLVLKGNQPLLYEEVRDYFDKEVLENLKKKESGYKKTMEAEHGGTAVREYYIIEDVDWYSERKK